MSDRHLNRRKFLRLTAGAATGLLFVGCGAASESGVATAPAPTAEGAANNPPPPATSVPAAATEVPTTVSPTSAPTENTELLFWNYAAELDGQFTTMIDQFHGKHPNIKVKYETLPWDQYWQKLNATLVTGNPPDVWYTAPTFYFEYVDRGQLVELSSLIQLDDDIKEDNWIPKALDQWRVKSNGKLYGLPSGFVADVVFYNKDLFDAAGVKYPTEDWTWDDFLQMAKALTKTGSDGKTEVWGCTVPTGNGLDQIIESNGGHIINDDQTKCLMLDDPATAATIQFMADLNQKYKVAPPIGEFEGMGNPFMTGRVAMNIGLQIGAQGAKEAPFKWDNQLIPKGKVKRSNYGGADGFVISAPTKHQAAAFEFIKFMTSQAGPTLYLGTGIIPVRKDLAADPAFLKQPPPPEHYDVWPKAVEYSDDNYGRGFGEWQKAKKDALEAIWLGNATVEQGINNACQAMDAALTKINQEKQGS